MTQSTKYLKFGLRADKNLSDVNSKSESLTNLLNDLSVQTVETDPVVKKFDANDTSIVNATTNQITINAHGFSTGDMVFYSCTGGVGVTTTALAPLVSGTAYFVIKVSDTVIKLANNIGDSALGTAIDFTSTAISAAQDGENFHKLFKKSTVNTEFTSEDLAPINGIFSTGLADKLGNDVNGTAPGAPLIQSQELRELGNTTENFTRSSDNTLLTVQPRITIKDQIQNFKSVIGDPPSVKGGDGPTAFIVPRERVNPAPTINTTGNSSTTSPSNLSSAIYSTASDSTLPDILGPVKFWETGVWSIENQFPGTTFNDEYGLIQWIGYLGEFPTQTIKTNGFYIIEQDTVSTSDTESDNNWTTLASVVSETITINAQWSYGTVVTVTPNTASLPLLKNLALGMVINGGALTGRTITDFVYDDDGIPESFEVSGGTTSTVSSDTALTLDWTSGTGEYIRSPNFIFKTPTKKVKPRVRYTVFWPLFSGRNLDTKYVEIQRSGSLLSYTNIFSSFKNKSQGVYSYDFFETNRVSSRQSLSKQPITVEGVSESIYSPPTNALTNGVYATIAKGYGSIGPGRRFTAEDSDGTIKSTKFPGAASVNNPIHEHKDFIGSSIVIRTKNKLYQYKILETNYEPNGNKDNQAIIDPTYITKINTEDPAGGCPTAADNTGGADIVPGSSNFFVGMVWRHLGLIGVYRLVFSSASSAKLYAIENGEPVTSITSGDLLFQQELAWTNGDDNDSKLNQSSISDAITTPLVATKITTGSDGAGNFATVDARHILGQSDSAFINTESISNGLGNGSDAQTDVIVGVYASSGVRDTTRNTLSSTANNTGCRGVYGKLVTTATNRGSAARDIPLTNTEGIVDGDFVQFNGAIPLSTTVASHTASKIVLSADLTADIPAGRTIVIIPQGVPNSVYNNSSAASREECVLPLDPSAPFSPTDSGIATTSTNEDFEVEELKIDKLSLRVPAANIVDFVPSVNVAGDKFKTNDTIEIASHPFVDGDIVKYTKENSTLIAGLTDGAVYYVDSVTSGTIKLYAEAALSTVKDITAEGSASDTHKLTRVTESRLVVESFDRNFDGSSDSAILTATNRIVIQAHGFTTGDKVKYTAKSTVVTGLVNGTKYFVRVIDANTIELYDSSAEALNTSATTGIRTYSASDGTAGAKNHSLTIVFGGYIIP